MKVFEKNPREIHTTELTQEIKNLSRSVTSKEIELVIKTVSRNKSPCLGSFIGEFYLTFEKNYHQLFQNIESTSQFILQP